MSSFSNSSLVNYTKISKNSTNPRNHVIDTISIHTMAGNCTVETCGQIFTNSTGASSNYGIDSTGKVGLYVEEKNRSWCTSNKDNDHRAITIEVASITTGDYKCSDAAMKSLIKLCTDICKRNNIKKLVWSTNKTDRVNHKNGCNMSIHRDYAQKSCPGDYLYSKMGYIADEVNKLLSTKESTTTPENSTENTEKTIWNILDNNGLNDYAKAGIMGNNFAESGLQSINLQNSFEKKLGYTDESYTKAVDNKKYKNFAKDGAGYGLCQWTYHTRKQALLDYATKKEMSIGNLKMQVSFMIKELKSDTKLWTALSKVKSVKEASDLILLNYEQPADQSERVKKKRTAYGQVYFDKYNTIKKSNCPYSVRVTANNLSIRSKPGTNFSKVGSITDNGIYTIIEESGGTGASKWGLLKSKAGWISLDYIEKI